MKTSELTGASLDWAVAKCEGATDFWFDTVATHWVKLDGKERALSKGWAQSYQPSTNWAQGGPIIEREGIDIIMVQSDLRTWAAEIYETPTGYKRQQATTPLIAAMRCYVASKLGDTVEIPQGLIQ